MLTILEYVRNLIFPNVCGICEKIYPEHLCKKCEMRLKKIEKVQIDTYHNRNFKKHLHVFPYEGIIQERLLAFKFYEKKYIYHAFTNFMINNKKVCAFLKSYDIIIPVPIHYHRKLVRGFNQSALIAKELAKKITIHYAENVLIKTKNNKPQSTKNKKDRQYNVKDVYQVKNTQKIQNKKIVLLDDIFTTGSTVNECAKMLKQAGAKWVDIMTIAKD